MTIKDIAKLANVSPSTVSKIINGKASNIRPETREHVMEIVRQYHYSPSNYIRQVSTDHSYKLGLLLNCSFYNAPFLHSLVSSAKQLGYYPVVCCSDGDRSEEEKFLSFLSSDGVDGLIWERVDPKTAPTVPMLRDEQIPCLLIHEDSTLSKNQIPYAEYSSFAAKSLISHGHNRIAFVADQDTFVNRLFFEGFRSCMTSNMITAFRSDWISTASLSAIDLIKEGYTAAICVGKLAATSLSRQLLQLNHICPRDFSILVLSNEPESEQPDFSVISIPYEAYGAFAVSRIVQSIEHIEELPEFTPTPPTSPSLQSIGAPKNYPTQHILVVGSVHMDININSDNLPQLGRSMTVKAMNTSPGGKGVNQAIGLAKLKKEVYLIGRIGSDFDGIVVQDALSKYHVRTEGIIRDAVDTGKAFIYILDNGESAITAYSGANLNLSISDIQNNRHLFSNASFCLLQTEIPIDVVEYSALLAKQHKAKVILKPSSINTISDELLSMVDYFVPNESEINLLCPHIKDHQAQCQYLLDKGVGTVILTLGSRGCYLRTREESCYFPASGHAAVDTTGGCDAFISALTAYLTENADLHRAIHYANCAAGFCVSQLGVVPSLIDKEALDLYPYPGDITHPAAN